MSTSKLQRLTSEKLSVFFGGYTIRENMRPEWMPTDNGGRLELDFYIEELNCAIEVQGAQHYEYNELFHNGYDDFVAQQKRDKAKSVACERRGIVLYEVFDHESLDRTIRDMLRRHDMLPPEPEPEPGELLGPPIKKRKLKKNKGGRFASSTKQLNKITRTLLETAQNHLRKPTLKREKAIKRLVAQAIEKFGEDSLLGLPEEFRNYVLDIAKLEDEP